MPLNKEIKKLLQHKLYSMETLKVKYQMKKKESKVKKELMKLKLYKPEFLFYSYFYYIKKELI